MDNPTNEQIIQFLNTSEDEIKDWNKYLTYSMKTTGDCKSDYIQTALDNGATNFETEMINADGMCHEDCDIFTIYEEWIKKTCVVRYAEEGKVVRAIIKHYLKEYDKAALIIMECCEITGSNSLLSDALHYACRFSRRDFFIKLSSAMNLQKDSQLIRKYLSIVKFEKDYNMERTIRELFNIGLDEQNYSDLRYASFVEEVKDKGSISALRRFLISVVAYNIVLEEDRVSSIINHIDQLVTIEFEEAEEMKLILRNL